MADQAALRSLPLTDLSEDEAMFRDQVRDFAQREVRPLVRKMEDETRISRELIDKCFALGLMGVEIPEIYGGAGTTFFMSVLAVEELARIDASVAVLVDVQNTLVNNALLRWGSEGQKARYFPKLAASWVGAYALSESGSGSDAFALACRATDRGDHYELTGRKLWITNAAEAELFIVMANLAPEKGYKGITAFLIERSYPGFSVGKKEDKLGIRASSTCELILEGCRVPRENVLGEPGIGYKIAIETLNEGRIGIGAQMVGLAEGAMELGIEYAKQRQQFGKAIADFQAVQFLMAELATEIEAARLLTYNAARRRDIGEPFVKESAMAKLFASRTAEHVTSKVIEIYGGYGFTRDYPVEKYFRDQKVGQIYEGTSNMQLLVIAKQILGKLWNGPLLDLPARELLDQFGSAAPTPGGGSAAALAGATAAALVTMVTAMTKTRTGSAHERAELDLARQHASESAQRLRALVDEDAAAFEAVIAARRLPHDTEAQKSAREEAVAAALLRAAEVPMETARACTVVMGAASMALAYGNPRAASDAKAAGALAWAGLMAAVENVRINLEDQPQHPALHEVEVRVRESRERLKAFGLED